MAMDVLYKVQHLEDRGCRLVEELILVLHHPGPLSDFSIFVGWGWDLDGRRLVGVNEELRMLLSHL